MVVKTQGFKMGVFLALALPSPALHFSIGTPMRVESIIERREFEYRNGEGEFMHHVFMWPEN